MAYNKEEWEFESFNFDEVWAALSKSTTLAKAIEDVSNMVKEEVITLSAQVAMDEGYYVRGWSSEQKSAKEVRYENWSSEGNAKRRKNGTRGKNRLIDPTLRGADGSPDGVDYNGMIGIVKNDDYKAMWIEYGSISANPKFVLTTVSENVAARIGGDFEAIWRTEHSYNPTEMSKKISEGLLEKKTGYKQDFNAS